MKPCASVEIEKDVHILNPNDQITNSKFQYPNFPILVIGAYLVIGAWDLEFHVIREPSVQ